MMSPFAEQTSKSAGVDSESADQIRAAIAGAMIQTHKVFSSQGRSENWQLLWDRILFPKLSGEKPPGYDRLVARFGYQSPEEATAALNASLNQFTENLQNAFIQTAQAQQAAGALTSRETPSPRASSADTGLLASELALVRIAPPDAMKTLLQHLEISRCPWDEQDLAEIWKHQLRLPLSQLVDMSQDLLSMTLSPMMASDLTDWTLGELLRHPAPPLTWLEGLKRASRHETRPTARTLPKETAIAMYFAAIASALVKRETRISRSGDEVLALGFTECLGYPWLDEGTRGLLERARLQISRG